MEIAAYDIIFNFVEGGQYFLEAEIEVNQYHVNCQKTNELFEHGSLP